MPPPPAQLFASRVLLGPALRAQPDRRLVDLVRDGYDSAFEEIVRRYRRPLDRFAASIAGARAEDVVQDSFSKALQSLRRSEAEIELRPWLYRIVRNTALNDLRDRGPSSEQLLESLPGSAGADAAAERREELAQLLSRLRELPESQRAAIVMRELEGHSHEEIAAALGVSGGAARQAIHRARTALRDGFGLLVPMPVLRALAARGGEALGSGAAGGAGLAGAGLGGGAMKVGLATVLVAGSVAGGVALHRDHEKVGPEAAAAAPADERGQSGLPADGTRGTPRDGGRSGDAPHRATGRAEEASGDGAPAPAPQGALAAGSQTGDGAPHHAGGGSTAAPEDHHGGGPGPSGDESSHHGGLGGSDLTDDHSGPGGGGDGLEGESGGSHEGPGEDSSGSGGTGGEGSGTATESEPETESGSDSSGEGGSLESGTDGGDGSSGSSGSDGGSGTVEPAISGSDDLHAIDP